MVSNRLLVFITLAATILILFGCSSGGSPTLPEPGSMLNARLPSAEQEQQRVLWGVYNLRFDPATREISAIPVRDIAAHYNVTAFITPPACDNCIGIFIVGYNPAGWVYDIRVTLRNPTKLIGYDVRGTLLIGDETDSRDLVNADEYTELFDTDIPPDRNPFKAYATSQPGRKFSPDAVHEVIYKISFPPPPKFNVLYVIDASFPGNQREPFRIYNQEIGEGLDDAGIGSAEVIAYVQDWQGDIESVKLDVTPLGAPAPIDLTLQAGDLWRTEFAAEWGAPAGEYELWIEAKSAGYDVLLYDTVTATVAPYENTPPVWDDTIGIVSTVPGNESMIVTFGTASDPQLPITYVAYYSEDSPIDFGTASTVESDSGSPIIINGLTNFQTYYFAIRARDALGLEETNTNELPGTPGPFNNAPVWDDTIGVQWLNPLSESMEVGFGSATDPDIPVTYNIYYSETSPIDFGTAPSVNVPSSPGIVNSLDNSRIYFVAVRAMDNYGLEDDNTVELAGCPNLPPEWDDTVGIQGLTPLSESMQVEFGTATDPDLPVTYNIYYSLTTPIDFDTAPKINAASSPGIVDGLSNAETYHFAVRTMDGLLLEDDNTIEMSGCSNLPPDWQGPAGISGAKAGFDFAIVTFGFALDPDAPVTFNVYYSKTSPIDFDSADKITGVLFSPYTVGGLDHDETYHFAVRAEDALGLEDDNTMEASAHIWPLPHMSWIHPFGAAVFSSPTYNDVNGDNVDDIIVGGWSNNRVKALDGSTGDELWVSYTAEWVDSSPCLTPIGGSAVDDILVGCWDGRLYAIDGETGSGLWDYQTGGIVSSSPAVADIDGDGTDEAVFGSMDGYVYVVETNGGFQWRFNTFGGVFSSPALCDRNDIGLYDIFIGSGSGVLYSINHLGMVNWSYPTSGPINSSPAVGDIDDDGEYEVVVASMDGFVYALDMNGDLEWAFEIGGYIFTSPALGDVNGDGALDVALGADDDNFYLIDGRTGIPIWNFPSGNRIWSSAALVDLSGDGVLDVVVGSNDGFLWWINGRDGTELLRFETGEWIDSSPAVMDLDNDGLLELAFGCSNGNVYCISTNAPIPEPALMAWPKFRKNTVNTGSF